MAEQSRLVRLCAQITGDPARAVVGLLFGPGSPIFFTVLQERVPERMRGRSFGLVGASVRLILPIGMLAAGACIVLVRTADDAADRRGSARQRDGGDAHECALAAARC